MSIYEYELLVDADLGNYALTAKQAQVPMYGLSRIGTYDRYKTIYEKTYVSGQTTKTYYRDEIELGEFVTGKKQFELTDHLGNVLATVSDNKLLKEGELIVLDVFESGISTEGWAAFPSGAWVYTDDPNDRLVIDPPNQYEGAVNTINTVSGQTYWVHIDLNIGGGTSVGMSAYENGTATLLGSADVSSGGVVGFYFTANSTSTDIKVFSNDATPSTFYLNSVEIVETSFMADVHMKSDYYPYGMPMPGRSFSIEGYRFGLNGMEKDNEIKGYGNSYTTFFRQYDPRLGRWFSTDPVVQPWQSPYTAMDNNPIYYADPRGDNVISSIVSALEKSARFIYDYIKIAAKKIIHPTGKYSRIPGGGVQGTPGPGISFSTKKGLLIINSYRVYPDKERPGLEMDLRFEPSDGNPPDWASSKYRIQQTIYTNSNEKYPITPANREYPSEWDNLDVGDRHGTGNAKHIHYNDNGIQMYDLLDRGTQEGAVFFKAETSVIEINDVGDMIDRVITISWGYTVKPNGEAILHPIQEVSKPSSFHMEMLETNPNITIERMRE